MSTTDVPAIDVRQFVDIVCEKFGIDPNNLAQITISPFDVQATVYETNEEGKKFTRDGDIPKFVIKAEARY